LEYHVEKARIGDVNQIHKLVNHFASNGQMLPRSLSEIYENMRDYFVVRQKEEVMACIALHINWEDLAEVKSIAVSEEYQRHGVGKYLSMPV